MSAALVRRSASERVSAEPASGTGRVVRAGAKTARTARSRAAMLKSRGRPDAIVSATIIEGIPGTTGSARPKGCAFAMVHLLEYTSPPFFGPAVGDRPPMGAPAPDTSEL